MNAMRTSDTTRRMRRMALSVTTLAALWLPASASAQTFELTWTKVDCGGGTLTSGDAALEMTSSIGQSDAGTLSGGAFELTGGFMAVASSTTTVVTGACCYAGACTESTAAGCLPFVCDVADHLPASFAGCFGDADGNGTVNPGDRGFVSANIGLSDPVLVCLFDMDGNGVINPADRGFVSANIGLCTPLPDYQNRSGLNHDAPETRFGTATFMGSGTTCESATCP